MNSIAIGISHKTSPVALREKFFLNPAERESLLNQLKNDPSVTGAVILATCNRTEIHASLLTGDPGPLFVYLFRIKGIPQDSPLKNYFYIHHGPAAVRHLFNVAAGLDSLIIGEKEILGQIKDAFELSSKNAMMGKNFNILANLVLQAGKKVRHETEIGCGGSSVSWSAVAMAERLLGGLKDKAILIIGAGKMGLLTANVLSKKSLKALYVMNRTQCKAQQLTGQIGGTAVPFWRIKDILPAVDACICSVGAPHYVVEEDLVKEVMALRNHRKLILIDISVPRNIHPGVSRVEGVQLISIDELNKAVEENFKKRSAAMEKVAEIINTKINYFYGKLAKVRPALNQNGSGQEELSYAVS